MLRSKKDSQVSYSYLLFLFLKVGSISFGGFMALIAVLQKEMVEKDKKLQDHVLIDAVSLASLLPGPVAVNSVGYVGYYLRGFWGAMISMAAVIFPSFVLVLALSIIFFEYSELVNIQLLISYMMPAIVVIILTVAINMSKKHIISWEQYLIAITSLIILQWLGGIVSTLAVIVLSGVIGYFIYRPREKTEKSRIKFDKQLPRQILYGIGTLVLIIGLFLSLIFINGDEEIFRLNSEIFLTFSGMSLSLFGGGYVFIPIIQETIVTQMNWLSSNEFNTAIAISQITPGPILISATFIGYKVAGITGAIFATIGIFLPSGLLIIACSNYLHQVSDSASIKAIFKGLRPAIIGLIYSAGLSIALEELSNPFLIVTFVITLIVAIRFRLSTIWIMLMSIFLGLIGSFIL